MSTEKIQLNTIEEAIEDIRQGKIIIVVDDEDRENEGDFLAAAEKATPEMINFMADFSILRSNLFVIGVVNAVIIFIVY